MGKSQQSRRAERRKARAAGEPPHVSQRGESRRVGGASPPLSELFAVGAGAAFGPLADPSVHERIIQAVIMHPAGPHATATAALDLLLAHVDDAYEGGWQPADLAHVVRRRQPARVTRTAAALIAEHARIRGVADRAPERWAAQLASIGRPDRGWSLIAGNPWDAWQDTFALMGQLRLLRRLAILLPPPSKWVVARKGVAEPSAARRQDSTGHDPKMLARIRALLAKAEATTFAQEADACTSKAQELMTRYSISEALLTPEAESLDIASVRVHIDNPYGSEKVHLLTAVGNANKVRAIWDEEYGLATVVGPPLTLELVEMLFTSLLVQATRAMTEEGTARTAERGPRQVDRSPSFRRAFLLSYAVRIVERLEQAHDRAGQDAVSTVGSELVPLLARQAKAVETEFARLFPETREMGRKRVDARGWHAGRNAADSAVFATGQLSHE